MSTAEDPHPVPTAAPPVAEPPTVHAAGSPRPALAAGAPRMAQTTRVPQTVQTAGVQTSGTWTYRAPRLVMTNRMHFPAGVWNFEMIANVLSSLYSVMLRCQFCNDQNFGFLSFCPGG